MCSVVVLVIKPIAFLTFSLASASSLLKLPTDQSERESYRKIFLSNYRSPGQTKSQSSIVFNFRRAINCDCCPDLAEVKTQKTEPEKAENIPEHKG